MTELLAGLNLTLNSTRPNQMQRYFFDYFLGDILYSINLQDSVKIYDDVQGTNVNDKVYLNMVLPGISVGNNLA